MHLIEKGIPFYKQTFIVLYLGRITIAMYQQKKQKKEEKRVNDIAHITGVGVERDKKEKEN